MSTSMSGTARRCGGDPRVAVVVIADSDDPEDDRAVRDQLAGWRQGEDVMIVPSVSDDEAAARYPHGWEAPLPYLRPVKQPT